MRQRKHKMQLNKIKTIKTNLSDVEKCQNPQKGEKKGGINTLIFLFLFADHQMDIDKVSQIVTNLTARGQSTIHPI